MTPLSPTTFAGRIQAMREGVTIIRAVLEEHGETDLLTFGDADF